jgi:tetratricopeptide (TPR) repeat protein
MPSGNLRKLFRPGRASFSHTAIDYSQPRQKNRKKLWKQESELMGQAETYNTDARLNELADKFGDSIAKLADSANKFSQSSARIERALVSRHSTVSGLFWLLILIIAAVAILYFTPNSGVKPYVDQSGAKIGLIATKVAHKITQEVDRRREANKTPAVAANKSTASLTHPAHPSYPVDQRAKQTLQPLSAQVTAKPAESEKVAVSKQQDKTRIETKTPAADQHATAPVSTPHLAQAVTNSTPTSDVKKTNQDNTASTVTARSSAPDHAMNPAMAARIAAREHRYGLAIGIYESYLDAHPEDADAWGELGNVQLSAGLPYDAAQNYYEASTRQIDRGQVNTVYPVLPIIAQYQPQLASILSQKIARMNFF